MRSNFVLFLKRELYKRIERNPNYSLRAFAKKLGISSGTLCDIFQNKRTLSLKNFEKIVPYFELSENEIEKYRNWVINNMEGLATFTELESDQAKVFGSPRSAAIVELLNVENFKDNIKLLSLALNISEEKCLQELKLLADHDIIHYSDGKYSAKANNYFAVNALPKTFFKDVIEKAHADIDELEAHDYMCLAAAYAINKEDLPEIKKKLLGAHSELTHWNEFRENKDSVYFLNINVSPL